MNINKFFSVMIVSTLASLSFGVDPVVGHELMTRSQEITARQTSNAVQIGGVAQVRYTYSTSNNTAYGFDLPYVRLDVHGDVGNGFNYRISPSADGNGDVTLQNAFVGYTVEQNKDFNVKVGQFRPQFMIELNGNDEDVVAANRSVVANTLGQTFTQGAELGWSHGPVCATVAFTDGVDHVNTVVDPVNNNYGVTARVAWNIINDAASGNKVTVGAGINHEDDFDVYTVDAGWTWKKFSAMLEYAHADTSISNAVVGTVAYECVANVEPFVRGEWAQVSGGEDLSIVTGGVNYYPTANKAVKWTNQVGYSFNSVSGVWDTTNTGWAAGGDDGDVVVVSQLQVSF